MKKINLFFFTLLLNIVSAQTQIGLDIDGENAHFHFGHSVSMPDTNTLGVGALYQYQNNGFGQVRVYSWNGTDWVQKGSNLNGQDYFDSFGYSISMPDMNTIAVGAVDNYDNGIAAGQVRVYNWNGSDWEQKGSEINGEAEDDGSGFSISMPDVNTIAIGAPRNDGNGAYSGHVRVYGWNGTDWTQKGIDIDGETAGDFSGWSVTMPDANTVAIGAIGNDGNGDFSGHVRIYNWNGDTWIQKGSNINGKTANEEFGDFIDMPDANTIAIGSMHYDGVGGSDSGYVRIHEWDGYAWIQKGEDIYGEIMGEGFGRSISMPDANTLAIGASYRSENGTDSGQGQVRIFKWSGSEWVQFAEINGEAVGDRSGWSLSMPDTETIAIGAYNNDGNGIDSGHVRVFDLGNLDVIDNTFDRDISVYPNPTKGKVTIDLGSEYRDIQVIIRNIIGQEINRKMYQSPNKKIELTINESNGLYLIELITSDGNKAILKVIKQ